MVSAMLRCLALSILLLLAACAGAPVAPPALSAAAALHWTVETAAGTFLGSATAIGPDILLTNRHVVAAAGGQALVVRRAGLALPVLRLREGRSLDIALLELPAPQAATPLLRADAPPAGTAVAVAGARRGQMRVESGQALAPGQARHFGPGLLVTSLPVAPGFSGGPVVDEAGRLVGIVMAGVAVDLAEARRLSASASASGETLAQRLALLIAPQAALADLEAESGRH
jgi:S1-C subfamily serine protease